LLEGRPCPPSSSGDFVRGNKGSESTDERGEGPSHRCSQTCPEELLIPKKLVEGQQGKPAIDRCGKAEGLPRSYNL